MEICNCGLIKQSKAGTRLDNLGVERCNNCQRPATIEAGYRSGPATSAAVSPDMMTTLDHLPGHRVVKSHGVVTELSATAGFTAESKGTSPWPRPSKDWAGAPAGWEPMRSWACRVRHSVPQAASPALSAATRSGSCSWGR